MTMQNIDDIVMMLAPENEVERIRIKLRLQEITTEVRIYKLQNPNSKLSTQQIFKRVKRNIAWRIIKNYLFSPFRKLQTAFGLYGLL